MSKYILSFGVPSIKCTQPCGDPLSQNKFTIWAFPQVTYLDTHYTTEQIILFLILYTDKNAPKLKPRDQCFDFQKVNFLTFHTDDRLEILCMQNFCLQGALHTGIPSVCTWGKDPALWQLQKSGRKMRFPRRHRSQSGPDSPRTTPCFHPRSKLQIKELLLWIFLSGRTCLTCWCTDNGF